MNERVDYTSGGVDLAAAEETTGQIVDLARSTYTDGVLAGAGPFSGLFRLDIAGMQNPVMVSSCDGVGTKLKLAIRAGRHQTIGADLVNHCVNDILTCGARPLTFLDYIALGKMDPAIVSAIVSGIADACRVNGIALIGGETAEMPGIYRLGEYDLAGFINGIIDQRDIVDGSGIRSGQSLIGIASNGPHTNGYSLIRKVLFDVNSFALEDRPEELNGKSLGEAVLAVHTSYKQAVEALQQSATIHGMAHITGGGISGNLMRILPEGMQAVVDCSRWPTPPIFTFLQKTGRIDPEEMHKVFNMGIGYIVVVSSELSTAAIGTLSEAGYDAYLIGNISNGPRAVRLNIR